MSTGYASHLTEGEWRQLQQLLVKARNSGQLGEVCLQARVDGEEIVRQQMMWKVKNPEAVESYIQLMRAAEAKRAEAGIDNGGEKPSAQGSGSQGLSKDTINHVVSAMNNEEDKKIMAALAATASSDGTINGTVVGPASAKKSRPEPPTLPVPAPQIGLFPMGSDEAGAMSDACKRRFDPADEIAMDEEFEVVNPTVYDPVDCKVDMASMIAGMPAPSAAAWHPGSLGYQEGGQVISEAERGWFPPISTNLLDDQIPMPNGVANYTEWGHTRIVMPKYKDAGYTYEAAMRLAMGSDREMARYLQFILRKFGPSYLKRGSQTQAEDLAGYLLRGRFRVGEPPNMPVQAPGFKREY